MDNQLLLVINDFHDSELMRLKLLQNYWDIKLAVVVPKIPDMFFQLSEVSEYNSCQVSSGKKRINDIANILNISIEKCYLRQGRINPEVNKLLKELNAKTIVAKSYTLSIFANEAVRVEQSVDSFLETYQPVDELMALPN